MEMVIIAAKVNLCPIAWPERYHLLHNWQVLGILIVTAIELLFAFRRG
jgi:hypothetical protein